MATQCYQITLYAVLICVSFIVNTWANLEEKMAAFINAEQAKIMSNQAYLDIEIYKLRLASLMRRVRNSEILQYLLYCQNIYP